MVRSPPRHLLALAGGLLAAGALGVQLGESAIAEIDPIHFQGAAVHPRDRGAAIDPNAVAGAEPGFAQAYGWEEGHAARQADCDGCDVLTPYEAFAYVQPTARTAEAHWQEPEPVAVAVQPWPPGEVAAPGEHNIERYTDYPIEEKPVEAPEAPEAPARPEPVYEE